MMCFEASVLTPCSPLEPVCVHPLWQVEEVSRVTRNQFARFFVACEKRDAKQLLALNKAWGDAYTYDYPKLIMARALAHTKGPLDKLQQTIEEADNIDPPLHLSGIPFIMLRCLVLIRATCEQITGTHFDMGKEWGAMAANVLKEESEQI